MKIKKNFFLMVHTLLNVKTKRKYSDSQERDKYWEVKFQLTVRLIKK